MDGTGRWALRRGLPRSAGHRAGIAAVRAIVEAAPESGIGILTLFAFSSDNWKRPSEEVNALMWLLRGYLRAEAARFIESGARLIVIGRRDRLSARLRHEIQRIEHATRDGQRLCVRIQSTIRRATRSSERRADAPSTRARAARILRRFWLGNRVPHLPKTARDPMRSIY